MTRPSIFPLASWPITIRTFALMGAPANILTGFVVGDGRPSVVALGLHAVLHVLIARFNPAALRRGSRPLRLAAASQQYSDPHHAETPRIAARRQALALGLHWVEDDGTIVTEEERMIPAAEAARQLMNAFVPDPIPASTPVRIGRGGDTYGWARTPGKKAGRAFGDGVQRRKLAEAIDSARHHVRDCACFDVVGERVVGFTDPRCLP